MSNMNISEKGRALLKKPAAIEVLKETIRRDAELSATGSLAVKVGEKTINIRVPR